MSSISMLITLWILTTMAIGDEMNQIELEVTTTMENYLTHIEITHHDLEDRLKRPRDRTLKRSKRTLVLLRNLDSEKGASIGDWCSYEDWNTHVNKMYNISNSEGKKRYKKGMNLANLTRIYVENSTYLNSPPGSVDVNFHKDAKYKSVSAKLCIGRYPLKCNEHTSKCECLDLYPLYNFTQDLPDEKFCNVRLGDFCDESVDLFCAHSYACINKKCQVGPKLSFNGQPSLTLTNSNKHKVFVMCMYILLMIMCVL